YVSLKTQMQTAGIHVLENEFITISNGNDKINIIGINDPSFDFFKLTGSTDEEIVATNLNGLTEDLKGYNILLSHRPELIDIYASFNINLVFSGHAHGGQIRIPF